LGHRGERLAMATLESTVTIARPVQDVFRFFFEFDENASSLGVDSVVKEPEGSTGAGTTFHLRDESRGKLREATTRFTSIDHNRRIGFDGKVGPLRPEGAYIFDPAEGGTRLTVQVDANPVGPLKLASPLVRLIGKRVWDKRLQRIQAVLETPAV
jgi:Polyketide cyclase / dehydrase and lipid transport